MTREQLEENAARAEMCAEATIPGDVLREILRLALIGIDYDEESSHETFQPRPR